MARKHAFTLVELLVVIGIIAVLIAILLPALGRARESGNTVACASNLRQTGLAMLSYLQNSRAMLPRAYGNHIVNTNLTDTSTYSWFTILVGNNYIYAPQQESVTFTNNENLDAASVGNSALMCPNTGPGVRIPWGWPAQWTFADNTYAMAWRHEDGHDYGGGKASPLIIDSSYMINSSQGDWTGISGTGGNPFLAQWNTAHRLSIKRRTADIKRSAEMLMISDGNNFKFGAAITYMNPRHGGRSAADAGSKTANLLMFDGHVEVHDPRTLMPSPPTTWQPSRTSRTGAPYFRIQDQ